MTDCETTDGGTDRFVSERHGVRTMNRDVVFLEETGSRQRADTIFTSLRVFPRALITSAVFNLEEGSIHDRTKRSVNEQSNEEESTGGPRRYVG